MYTIFYAWGRSLKIFSLDYIKLFFLFVATNFVRAAKFLIQTFWWLFLVDAIFFIYCGDLLNKVPSISSDPTQPVNSGALFLHLINSIIFFVLSTAFLLSIRKPEKSNNHLYFKNSFLRYIQLQLIFSLVFLFILNLLVSSGISTFPKLNWVLSVFFSLIELIIVFYWLDSDFRLREILYSLEKTLNLILYNIPFFILIFVVLLGSKFGLGYLFSHFGLVANNFQILGKMQKDFLLNISTNSFTTIYAIKYLAMKYVAFFCDYFFISLIFAFYLIKKHETYTASIFEVKENIEE